MKNFLIDRHSPLSLYYSVYCFFWHGDDYDDACGLKATAFFCTSNCPTELHWSVISFHAGFIAA